MCGKLLLNFKHLFNNDTLLHQYHDMHCNIAADFCNCITNLQKIEAFSDVTLDTEQIEPGSYFKLDIICVKHNHTIMEVFHDQAIYACTHTHTLKHKTVYNFEMCFKTCIVCV